MDNKDTQNFENPQQGNKTYVTYIPYGLNPTTYEERKEVRKTANMIGAVLLIVLAFSESVSYLLSLAYTVFGFFDRGLATKIFTDPAFDKLVNAAASFVIFTVPFFIVFKICKIRMSGLARFKPPKAKEFFPYFLMGVGFCAVANIAVSYLAELFSIFGIEYNVNFGDNPDGILGFIICFFTTAVTPALVEEFAYRGMIMGSTKKYSESLAIVSTAILFGLVHCNFEQIPFACLVGLILGFVAIKTKSIWTAVAIHFTNNFVSVFFDYAFLNYSDAVKNICYVAYLIVAIILGVFGVYLLSRRNDSFTLKPKKTESGKAQLYKWFFTSPTIIIFAALCLIKSFRYFS